MAAPFSLAEAAQEVGLSPDRLRKRWKWMSQNLGLPAPFTGGPRGSGLGNYQWEREPLLEWKRRRSTAVAGAPPTGEAANFNEPPRLPSAARINRGRNTIARLMGAAS